EPMGETAPDSIRGNDLDGREAHPGRGGGNGGGRAASPDPRVAARTVRPGRRSPVSRIAGQDSEKSPRPGEWNQRGSGERLAFGARGGRGLLPGVARTPPDQPARDFGTTGANHSNRVHRD